MVSGSRVPPHMPCRRSGDPLRLEPASEIVSGSEPPYLHHIFLSHTHVGAQVAFPTALIPICVSLSSRFSHPLHEQDAVDRVKNGLQQMCPKDGASKGVSVFLDIDVDDLAIGEGGLERSVEQSHVLLIFVSKG